MNEVKQLTNSRRRVTLILLYGRDGNVPVSFIQKYLVKKLDLTSEVEVRCVDKLYVQIIFS